MRHAFYFDGTSWRKLSEYLPYIMICICQQMENSVSLSFQTSLLYHFTDRGETEALVELGGNRSKNIRFELRSRDYGASSGCSTTGGGVVVSAVGCWKVIHYLFNHLFIVLENFSIIYLL